MACSEIIIDKPQMRFAMLLGFVDQKAYVLGCGVQEHTTMNTIRKINKGHELNKYFSLADYSMVYKTRGGGGRGERKGERE